MPLLQDEWVPRHRSPDSAVADGCAACSSPIGCQPAEGQSTDDIGIELDVSVDAPVLGSKAGKIGAAGKLSYSQSERAFYIDSAALERLDVPGLKPELHAKVSSAISQLLQLTLATVPVYTFKGRTVTEKAAATALEKVVVRDGNLVATLTLP